MAARSKTGRPGATLGRAKRLRKDEPSVHAITKVCPGCCRELSQLAFPRVPEGRGDVCRNCKPHGRPLDEFEEVA